MPDKGVTSPRTTFGIAHLRGPLMARRWPSLRDLGAAALLYLVLAAVALLPLWSSWSTAYVGPAFGSSQIWQMQQVWEALLAGDLPPLSSVLLSYPEPGALVFVGWPFMAIGLLFRFFMGTIPAVNCTLLIFLAAGSFTMFLFAFRCSGSRHGSLLAGALYGFSTYAMSALANGHIYSMFVLWLPLLVLTYDSLLSRLTVRTAILFAATVLLAVLESPYRLVEAVPVLVAWTVHYLTAEHSSPAFRWSRVGAAALVCSIMLMGPLAYFRLQLVGEPETRLYGPMEASAASCTPGEHPGLAAGVDGGLIGEGWLDPVALVRPGFLYDRSVATDIYNAHHVLYLGVLLPVLLFALWRVGRNRGRLLAWTLLLGMAMALGPALHWGGRAICVGGSPLPGPMAFLEYIPGAPAMGAFYRTFLSVMAVAALLVALVWPVIGRGRSRPVLLLITGLAMVLLLADAALVSPLRMPVPIVDWAPPLAAQTLASQPDSGGVLVVPDIHRESLRDGEERLCGYVWQLHVRKPLRFQVPELCAAEVLLNLAKAYEMPRYDLAPSRDGCLQQLRILGIKWVLFIGPNAHVEGHYKAATRLLDEWFGEPLGEESKDGSRVYRVPLP